MAGGKWGKPMLLFSFQMLLVLLNLVPRTGEGASLSSLFAGLLLAVAGLMIGFCCSLVAVFFGHQLSDFIVDALLCPCAGASLVTSLFWIFWVILLKMIGQLRQ